LATAPIVVLSETWRRRFDSEKKTDPMIMTEERSDMDDNLNVNLPEDVICPYFQGLDETHVTFLTMNRLTSSDVFATTVTVQKKLIRQTSLSTKMMTHHKTKLKLPSPKAPMTLPIPRKRMNKILLSERDAFMSKLFQERAERNKLENWAATRIQALFRGYLERPHPIPTYERKQRTNTVTGIQNDVIRTYLILSYASYTYNDIYIYRVYISYIILYISSYKRCKVARRISERLPT
jgi:hypothetical protein